MSRFEGKVALLTGAASGIGRATALQLAGEGATVMGLDVNQEGLDETAAMVAESGGTIHVQTCDVRSRKACFDAVDDVVGRFGKLDILGNIAGVNRFAHFHEMSEDEWNLLRAVNIDGVFYMCQAAIPPLLETQGSIVTIASVASLRGQAYTAAYSATKGAVKNLMQSLAMEYVRKGIRINAIAPGMVDTGMNVDIDFPDDINGKLIQRYSSFRGGCEPAEIARVFAFLASDEAPYVHGAIWPVDGGTTAG